MFIFGLFSISGVKIKLSFHSHSLLLKFPPSFPRSNPSAADNPPLYFSFVSSTPVPRPLSLQFPPTTPPPLKLKISRYLLFIFFLLTKCSRFYFNFCICSYPKEYKQLRSTSTCKQLLLYSPGIHVVEEELLFLLLSIQTSELRTAKDGKFVKVYGLEDGHFSLEDLTAAVEVDLLIANHYRALC